MSETLDKILIVILGLTVIALSVMAQLQYMETKETLQDISATQIELRDAILSVENQKMLNFSISDNTSAVYHTGTGTICIYTMKADNIQEIENNFYHELGHAINYQYLEDKDWQNYRNINETNYVSEYAKTSITEDFAENYMNYRLNKTINKEKELIIEKYK